MRNCFSMPMATCMVRPLEGESTRRNARREREQFSNSRRIRKATGRKSFYIASLVPWRMECFPGPLVAGPSGTLFGTSAGGGTCSGAALDDCGTIFKIAPGPDEWTHTVVHGFAGGSDGASVRGGLIRDADGNLYGTTQLGGAFGFGTIFRIDASGNKTILYSFAGADGANPVSGLIRDKYGSLWGTTSRGGNSQMGTVFKLDGTGHLTVLHNFGGGNDGAYPYGPLQRSGATLFGTTTAGGVFNQGTVFRLTP